MEKKIIPIGGLAMVSQSILVEIPLDANQENNNEWNLEPEPELYDKRIVYIEAFCAETMSHAPSGNELIDASVFKRAYLTLYTSGEEGLQAGDRIRQMPFVNLSTAQDPTGTAPYSQHRLIINNTNIVWNKGNIRTGGVLGAANINKSFLFNVIYTNK